MSLKTMFNWNKPVNKISDEVTKDDKVLLFMANEAKKLMDPYVPADSLTMSKGAKTYTESGRGIVEYPGPYARFQFEGKVMVGVNSRSPYARKGESKIVTGGILKHSKFRHPLATSHWDKAMMTARGADLARAVQNYIKRKG